ncbi:hypothetical protein [Brevundimonas bacteroides]|uniref:hypothetical protein n=1 Tax=Brevundimonas bacteroides TaxID=74311 RepID=UPI000497A701|nr:hypothetical protein [Brevundimonas bacteroides]
MFQLFYLVSTFAVWAIVWWKGAKPERLGVLLLIANYTLGGLLDPLRLWWTLPLNDLACVAVLLWMAFRFDRWWILAAAAAHLLLIVVHISVLSDPSLDMRVYVASRWVFGVIGLYALLAGALERWLAGEPAGGWPLSFRMRRG